MSKTIILIFVLSFTAATLGGMRGFEIGLRHKLEEHATETTQLSNEKDYLQKQLNRANAYMRTMAYHQAIAEMEMEYPLAIRSMLNTETWEAMVSDRCDAIMGNAVFEFAGESPWIENFEE